MQITAFHVLFYAVFRAVVTAMGVAFPVELIFALVYILFRLVTKRHRLIPIMLILGFFCVQLIIAFSPGWSFQSFVMRLMQLSIPVAIWLCLSGKYVTFRPAAFYMVLFVFAAEFASTYLSGRMLLSGNQNSSSILYVTFFLLCIFLGYRRFLSSLALLGIPVLFFSWIQTAVAWFVVIIRTAFGKVLTVFFVVPVIAFVLYLKREWIDDRVGFVSDLIASLIQTLPLEPVGSLSNRANAVYFLLREIIYHPFGMGVGQSSQIITDNARYFSVGTLHNAPLVFIAEFGLVFVIMTSVYVLAKLSFSAKLFFLFSMLILVSLSDNAFSHSGFWLILIVAMQMLNRPRSIHD